MMVQGSLIVSCNRLTKKMLFYSMSLDSAPIFRLKSPRKTYWFIPKCIAAVQDYRYKHPIDPPDQF